VEAKHNCRISLFHINKKPEKFLISCHLALQLFNPGLLAVPSPCHVDAKRCCRNSFFQFDKTLILASYFVAWLSDCSFQVHSQFHLPATWMQSAAAETLVIDLLTCTCLLFGHLALRLFCPGQLAAPSPYHVDAKRCCRNSCV
jgi:anaerobic C4-dicarboxylate transporter